MTTVSAILAARNEEAHIAETVRSLAAQPGIGEIIVVDDQSTDRTGEILRELAAQIRSLKILDAPELPPGWTGKSHAVWLGAQVASGEWLLFTDADVTHLPGSAARALADAQASGAALVSYSPEQETRAWWERAVTPLVFTRLAGHFRLEDVRDPASPAAAANGQYLLIRRDAYAAIGGHAAVRGHVVEDVALARRAKAAGYRLHFASGSGIARTRMYGSFAELWQGWTKNLFALVGGTRAAVLREVLVVVPWLLLALVGLLWGASIAAWAALAVLLAGHVAYGVALRRIQAPLSAIVYYVPGSLLYVALLLASARRWKHGRVVWKGREYSPGV